MGKLANISDPEQYGDIKAPFSDAIRLLKEIFVIFGNHLNGRKIINDYRTS